MILTVEMRPCVDITVKMKKFKPGKTNTAEEKIVTYAGKANNVATGITRLGGKAYVTGFMYNENGSLFEKTLDKKAALIDELNQMDEGFQQLYEKVRPEIQEHMEHYADKIRMMQEEIQKITDKTVAIQTEELRNKQLVENKFSSIKKQIREVKSSQKMVNRYYQNIMQQRQNAIQYMDNKK